VAAGLAQAVLSPALLAALARQQVPAALAVPTLAAAPAIGWVFTLEVTARPDLPVRHLAAAAVVAAVADIVDMASESTAARVAPAAAVR
jgi:hypothetical protein